MNRPLLFPAFAGLLALALGAADPPKPFELKDGDRVVLLGNTFIERDQEYGYLETLLTLRNPDKKLTFRNLGWSGDAVSGIARARFGTPEEGFQHLKEHVLALKPTVLIVCYGMNESFEGEKGLPEFEKGLNRLLDTLAETKARVVLLSPIRHEDMGRPLPDPSRHNRDLERYYEVILTTAARRNARFIDLFSTLHQELSPSVRLTDDGIHLTRFGYWQAARVIGREFGASANPPGSWKIEVDRSGKVLTAQGIRVDKADAKDGTIRVEATESQISGLGPVPTASANDVTAAVTALQIGDPRDQRLTPTLRFRGIPTGSYILKVDGKANPPGPGGDSTVYLISDPDRDRVEKLRAAIVAKNLLYFYRWRPQNETYLFGFRKHEQGQNAREIPLFDPLVEAKEKEIAALKAPATHTYELIREGEANK